MAGLRDFSIRMNELASKVLTGATAAQRQVAQAIIQPLVMATPVGNVTLWNKESRDTARPGYVGGRARANWHVTLGAADDKVSEATDAGGGQTISKANAAIEESTPRQAIYLNNNLPYIVPLNEGHSLQAPAGFVETAVEVGLQKARKLHILD